MKQIFAILAGSSIAGCATHTWAPAAGKDPNQYTSDKARCSIMARHGNRTSWYAEGKPEYVAGVALGAAIGDAIGANQDFNDCMQAVGWEIADDRPTVQPVAYQAPVYQPPAPDARAEGWQEVPAPAAPTYGPPPPAPDIRPARLLQMPSQD